MVLGTGLAKIEAIGFESFDLVVADLVVFRSEAEDMALEDDTDVDGPAST